jgi:hypothetical protein
VRTPSVPTIVAMRAMRPMDRAELPRFLVLAALPIAPRSRRDAWTEDAKRGAGAEKLRRWGARCTPRPAPPRLCVHATGTPPPPTPCLPHRWCTRRVCTIWGVCAPSGAWWFGGRGEAPSWMVRRGLHRGCLDNQSCGAERISRSYTDALNAEKQEVPPSRHIVAPRSGLWVD